MTTENWTRPGMGHDAHHHHGHDHHGHDHWHAASERRMWMVLALTVAFLVVEIVGGILTGSLALLSDAAHMFTDTMALAIAIAAIRLARMPADRKRTFGYYRFEVLAAALNAVLLFLVALYILYEAYERWMTPRPIASLAMLGIAAAGLGVNLAGMRLLAADAGRNLNIKGAYLEVWADAVGSLGVIAGALVVYFTGFTRADPIVAVLIAAWVLPRSWALLRQSVNVLLEGVPEGVDLAQIDEHLRAVPGVREVHELHVWSLGSGRTSLTAHLILDEAQTDLHRVIGQANERLRADFGITHTTLQAEIEHCDPQRQDCLLDVRTEHDAHAGHRQ